MAPQKYFLTISFLVLSYANSSFGMEENIERISNQISVRLTGIALGLSYDEATNLTNIQETDIVDHIEFSKDSTKECYSATLANGNMIDTTKNLLESKEEIDCYIITAPTSCTPFGTLIPINDVWFSILKRKYEDQVGKLQ